MNLRFNCTSINTTTIDIDKCMPSRRIGVIKRRCFTRYEYATLMLPVVWCCSKSCWGSCRTTNLHLVNGTAVRRSLLVSWHGLTEEPHGYKVAQAQQYLLPLHVGFRISTQPAGRLFGGPLAGLKAQKVFSPLLRFYSSRLDMFTPAFTFFENKSAIFAD